jgi:Protein of unknown function (DUF3455)
MRSTLALRLLAVFALAFAAEAARAEMPAAVAAPEAKPVVTLHAEGAQLYECKTAADGKLAWVFREPIASLMLDGQTVGRHYAGPTWEHMGGSAVTGKFLASSPGATANDIPWLKLEVASRRGRGLLADIDIIQRISTSGGVLHGACEQAGALRSVPYSADYVFLRKGG